ncbi:response regulator [Sphingomonas aerophila]|uniref:DNA-binding response OmpR family regulator n=1 Tax=Sphingomonas aerophila TaxID=1344948 RepID=A0A7W9BH42_9SPHN|nr:response regulator [Sphingomonas aerophila]MBB5716923.1 DNA-binding response OmpR family regulator [Sphingomonas aerophila]
MEFESVILLVVEDEPAIQLFLEDTLQDAGFSVRVACQGDEAISLLDGADFAPVGVVTDIRLGKGLKGWDVARHARELHPEIAIVYVTGDSAADWQAYGVPKSVLLPKPFAGAQLVTAVATLLNEQTSSL